ncbi:glycosyltransferase family 39 protein [bacterium]|nr:glycosyltransferase family 39 protein [bacterium]
MIKNTNNPQARQTALLLCVAGAGVILRILDSWHVPVFMDELPILYNVAHFLNDRTLTPVHFNYPTFFSYLSVLPTICVFVVFYLFQGYPVSGLANGQWMGFLFEMHRDVLVFGGRIVSVLAFMGICLMIIRFQQKRLGFWPVFIALLMLSLDPLGGRFVTYSGYALPDTIAAFLVTWAMLLCFEYLETGNIRWIYLACFVTGLGISTKYNAGMAVIPVIVSLFMVRPEKTGRAVLIMGGLGLAGFLAGSPAVLWAPQRFIEGYIWESRHMAEGHLGGHDVNYWWVFKYIMSCKTWMLPWIVLSVFAALLRREKRDWVFLALLVPSFLVIGRFEKKAIHYFLFLYPLLALFAGETVSRFRSIIPGTILRRLFVFLMLFQFLVYPGYRICKMVRRDLTVDNRLLAETWIEKEIPSDSRIMLDPLMFSHLMPAEKSAGLQAAFNESGNPFRVHLDRYFEKKPVYRFFNIRNYWDKTDSLLWLPADYIVISGQNYQRFFVGDSARIPDSDSPLFRTFMDRRLFYRTVMTDTLHFAPLAVFQGPAGPDIRIYRNRCRWMNSGIHGPEK